MPENTPIVKYLLQHPEDLLWRDVIIELFAFADRIVCHLDTTLKRHVIKMEGSPYVGKLVVKDKHFYRVEAFSRIEGVEDPHIYAVDILPTGIVDDPESLLCEPTDIVYLPPGIIANHAKGETIETSVGLFVLNYVVLATSFGDKIPYINGHWNSGSLQRTIGDMLINKVISPEQMVTYANHLFYIGPMTEIFAPNLTHHSLTTDPKMNEYKEELIKENAEGLAAGNPITMVKIEKALIEKDKEYNKGDPAELFLIKGKYWNVVRKKLYCTHGMVERFGAKGTFDFVPNSLGQGWTQDAFAILNNETRSGSYSRAMETAEGGAKAKEILRVFQNTRVTEQDCHTTVTVPTHIRDYNASEYIYRHIVLEDGTMTEITAENYKSFIGQVVNMRSPEGCKTKNGYCYTCVGRLFESLGQDAFATVVQALASDFLLRSLKRMHGVVVATYRLGPLNDYLV